MILTVTLNPSIDRTMEVDALFVGTIHRPRTILELAGGKGMNVARAAANLGADAIAAGIVAGLYGRHFSELAASEAFTMAFVRVRAGSTRICTSVVDLAGNTITEFYEQGTPFPAWAWARLRGLVRRRAGAARAVTISGGAPPGASSDLVAGLASEANAAMRDGLVIVDSHGPQLLSALAARPTLVKVNASEAAEATGLPIGSPDDALRACRALVDLGARSAVVTLGATGSVGRAVNGAEIRCSLSEPGGQWSVGSGDAFLAAAAVRLAEGSNLATAMADATAAGGANAKMMGAGRFDPAEVERLRKSVVIDR